MKTFFLHVICISLCLLIICQCALQNLKTMNPEISRKDLCSELRNPDDLNLTFTPSVDGIQQNQFQSEKPDYLDLQALTAVKFALKFKQKNNLSKAAKLFQHALTSSPNHPKVLLHYGEFLESSNDFINADTIYCKTLGLGGPENSQALANHKRLLPLVINLDETELKRIDHKRTELDNLNPEDSVVKSLKKELYFQNIYHTVGIEGNTLSLTEVRTFIENGKSALGKSASEHNEILGMQTALSYVEQTLADKRDINITDILEIHKRVMGLVDPLAAGIFRKSQVYVGEYKPPAASDVKVLMEEFVSQLQSSHTKDMHPVLIAAFAHHKVAFIHPFLDGNGRTSRLLMNLIFEKYGYPAVIIRKGERIRYFNVLRIASEGDRRPFYRFIARAVENMIDVFLHAHKCREIKLPDVLDDNVNTIPLAY